MCRLIIVISSLLLAACGEMAQFSDEQELYYNHLLLKAYFYKPERVKEYSAYEGMEVGDMYLSLNDLFKGNIYTWYSPPGKADEQIKIIENTPQYYSFGFERDSTLRDTLRVSEVYPISPAANAGLKKHDRLLMANNISLVGADNVKLYLNSDSLFETTTAFKVFRMGDTLRLPPMQKAEVQEPTVYLDYLESLDSIPFIRVTQYKVRTNDPNGTYAEFKNVLQEIKGKGAKKAIMDLRNNPGGNIDHCTAMAAELVPFERELIFDVEHYYDARRGNVIDTTRSFVRDFVKSDGIGVGIDWILLMNGGSASCAERFAAAVKYNRPETIIVGETSYGKGIGQMYTKTYLGGLAYITCIQSYYPNGKTFHEVGIAPDRASLDGILAKHLPQKMPPTLRKAREPEFGAYKFLHFPK